MNEIGERAISVPIPVATPLPPLNFRKIDHVCPIKVANPQLITNESSNPKLEGVLSLIIPISRMGISPLLTSKSKTRIPGRIPTVLITFAMPVFPLPKSLMSTPFTHFDMVNPVGIEPRRYEPKIKTIYVMISFISQFPLSVY